MSFHLSTFVRVVGVHEHHRTVSGRKNELGQTVMNTISLGWFLHLDFDGDGIGEISVGVGPLCPQGISVGDQVCMSLTRYEPPK